MKLFCFSVHDTKVGAFMPPFFMRSKGEAVRAFMDNAADGTSQLSKHPEDFALWNIGEFDDVSGQFTGNVEVIMRAAEVARE